MSGDRSVRLSATRGAACALLGPFLMVGAASATDPAFELLGRNADIQLSTITGGVGTASVAVVPSPDSVVTSDLAPAFLQVAGSGMASGESSPFTATIEAAWDLRQNYSVESTPAGAALHASGSIAVTGASFGTISGVPSVGPFTHAQHNYQSLRFSLSADTAFSVSGSTWGDEYIQLRVADTNAPYVGFNWPATYTTGPAPRAWSISGVLAAGDYVISNRLIPLSDSGWDYTMTFQGATVVAVPEPASAAMILAGIALMAAGARAKGRRPAGTRARA